MVSKEFLGRLQRSLKEFALPRARSSKIKKKQQQKRTSVKQNNSKKYSIKRSQDKPKNR